MFQWRGQRSFVIAGVSILVCTGVWLYSIGSWRPADPPAIPDTLPQVIGDKEFWRMIQEFSEPGGSFRSKNLLSNESGLQEVIPKLKEHIKPGGVYIGVGPEQNFTYILAFEPKISFIVDIRRLNMLQHLLYKALFEISVDRADFLSRLFSRQRPNYFAETMTAETLFDLFEELHGDGRLFEKNFDEVLRHLTDRHGFVLSHEDVLEIRDVLTNFFESGPRLSYSFLNSYSQSSGMPTYRQLLAEHHDNAGHNWSFLSTEDRFRRIQEIQRKNLIVPLVGDFAGPKALRAVGNYMAQHRALLSVFYTSNVEMYLFQQTPDWKDFYENVKTLPVNSASSFIRFAAGRRPRGDLGPGHYSMRPQMWSPVRDVLEAVSRGEIDDYPGVLGHSE